MANVTEWLLILLFIVYLGAPGAIIKPIFLLLKPFIYILAFVFHFTRLLGQGVISSIHYASIFLPIIIIFVLTIPIRIFSFMKYPSISQVFVEKLIGSKNIRTVRSDLLSILPLDDVEIDNEDISSINSIRENTKDRLQTGELIFTVIIGSILLLDPIFIDRIEDMFSLVISPHLILGLYILIITPAVMVRIALLDHLAYSSIEETKEVDKKVAIAWQEVITSKSQIQIASLGISLIRRLNRSSYDKALVILENLHLGDMRYKDLIKEVR